MPAVRDRVALRLEQVTIPPGHPWNRLPIVGAGCAVLGAAGAEVVRVQGGDSGLSWDDILAELAAREVMSLLLEGGSGVLTSAFEAGIISKLFLVYAPLLIGGSDALSLWGGEGIGELTAAPRLRHVRHFDLGDAWAVEGYLQAPEPPL